MLSLLPIGLNLLSAAVIYVLSTFKTNIGRVWFVAAILSLLNWGLILGLRWMYPIQLMVAEWFPVGEIYQRGIIFQLDSISWSILLALCAVQTAVIITDSSRLDEIPSPIIWSGIFLVYAVGILAALSSSIITIFLVWALVDIIEFIVMIRTVSKVQQINEIVVSFAVKILGLFFLIFSLLVSFNQGSPLRINQLTNEVGIFILIAVGLRLGVIPFNLPFVSGSPIRRGLGNAIRMVSVSTSVIVLLRIPIGLFNESAQGILLTLTAIGTFFGSIMWFGSSNELEGRPYWIISLAGLAIYSSINGDQLATLSWSLVLILSGSVLFLFSARGRRLTIIPLFAIIGIVGLPFTPAAVGWQGVIISGNFFRNVFNLLSVAFIVLGYLQHASYPTILLTKKERWIWLTYPIGLFILILTHWLSFLLSDLEWYVSGIVYASVIAFVLPLLTYFVNRKYIKASEYSELFQSILEPFGKFITNFLNLRWLYKLIWSLLGFFQKIVNIFTNILEGRGGIIWIIVLLIMLITLISSGDLI
ncbi:MAG: hypothetical protein Q7U53_04480 [Anaerolineaceae bacterium]|nr:hypothetical protein [Anaerolineaceae bacterium]